MATIKYSCSICALILAFSIGLTNSFCDTEFIMSTFEKAKYLQTYTDRLLGGMPESSFWFEPEAKESFNETCLFITVYYTLVQSDKDEQILYKNDDTDLQFNSGVAITAPELLEWKNEVRIMPVLRRNIRNKKKLFINYAYSRKGVVDEDVHSGYLINLDPVHTCVRSYLNVIICIELDAWEDRSEESIKPHWKYFGRLDCSSSIFTNCQFDPKQVEAEMQKAVERSESIADIVTVNEYGWDSVKPSKGQNLKGISRKDIINSIFSDLDMNRTEGRILRHAIRTMSVISEPIKMYLAVKDGPLEVDSNATNNETTELRGDVVKWLYVKAVNVTETGEEIDEAIKHFNQAQEQSAQAASAKLTEYRKLFRAFPKHVDLDEQLIDSVKKLDFMYQENKREFLAFQDTDMYKHEIQRWNSLKEPRNIEGDGKPDPNQDSNILNSVLGGLIQNNNSFGFKLGQSLIHVTPKLSLQENQTKEEEIMRELATGIINSPADLFRNPGWKMRAYSHLNITDCLRSLLWKTIQKRSSHLKDNLLTALSKTPYYAKIIEEARNISESEALLQANRSTRKTRAHEEQPNVPAEELEENDIKYSGEYNHPFYPSELPADFQSKLRRESKNCAFYDKKGFIPLTSFSKIERYWFFGFGSCETDTYEPTWLDAYAEQSDGDTPVNNLKKLKKGLGLLRVFCNHDSDRYLELLFKEKLIYLDKRNVLMINTTFTLIPKLTPIQSRMLSFAVELKSFVNTFGVRQRRGWAAVEISRKTSLTNVSNTIDFLVEMTAVFLKEAKQIDYHFFKLSRGLVLSFRTIMVKLIQDAELLNMWCPVAIREKCRNEIRNNQHDRVIIHSLIQFILHGLREVELETNPNVEKLYKVFYERNKREIERTSKFYDL